MHEPSIFLSLGELGPGDNIGLLASKTSATAVRGQYYAIAAAIGKIGAFVGTYVFPLLQDNPNPIAAGQNPFFVASALCIFASIIVFFGLPHVGQVSLPLYTIICRFIGASASATDPFFRILSPNKTKNSAHIWKPTDMRPPHLGNRGCDKRDGVCLLIDWSYIPLVFKVRFKKTLKVG